MILLGRDGVGAGAGAGQLGWEDVEVTRISALAAPKKKAPAIRACNLTMFFDYNVLLAGFDFRTFLELFSIY